MLRNPTQPTEWLTLIVSYFFMEVISVIAPHTPHSDCIHSPLSILISSIFYHMAAMVH